MNKIILILVFVGLIMLQGCTVHEEGPVYVDNTTIGEVFEYTNVDFVPNDFSVTLTFPHSIFSSDMVLVYRLSGIFQGEDVWKLLPETYYFDDGTLDFEYNFDFTKYDVVMYMDGFDLGGISEQYRLNQIVRVVIVPGFFGNKKAINFKDYNDYNAVIKAYNIDESKIIKMN